MASHVGLAISDYIALNYGARTAVVDENAVMGIAAIGSKAFDMHIVVIDLDSASTRDVNPVARVRAIVASAGANAGVFDGDVRGVCDIHAVAAGGTDPQSGIGDIVLAIDH